MVSSKAQLGLDLILVVVVLVVVAIVALLANGFFKDFNTELQADPDISSEAKNVTATLSTNLPKLFDNIFIFLLMGLWIAAILTSFLIDTHPIFFVVSILLLIILGVVGVSLSNVYGEMSGDADLSSSAADYPKTNWVFNNFLIVILVIGGSVAISLYAKYQAGP